MNIHEQGSIWHARVSNKDSVQKPAIILRACICVPAPHVTVQDVQLVQSEYTHSLAFTVTGVIVVNIGVGVLVLESGVVGVIQAKIPIVTCDRKKMDVIIFSSDIKLKLES